MPLDFIQDSPPDSLSTAGSESATPVSDAKKLISNVLQAARVVVAALAKPELPDPALVRGTAALKKSMNELLNGGHLEALHSLASRRIDNAVGELPVQLKQFCEQNRLHLWGAFPDYVLDGTVYFRVDDKNCRVQINDDAHPMFPLEANLKRLLEEVSKYSSTGFQADGFLRQLWQAYQLCLSRQKSSTNATGERVSVFEILPEVAFTVQSRQFLKNPTKGTFRPYSQHMLRADLYRVVSAVAEPAIEGLRLVLEPTSVAEDGLFMFLPSLGRCAFVGHIVFLPTR